MNHVTALLGALLAFGSLQSLQSLPAAAGFGGTMLGADSVRVILFALESPSEVRVVSGERVVVNGVWRPAGRPTVLVARSGKLFDGGEEIRRADILSRGGRILLRSGERQRVATGRIEITATGGRLQIVAHLPLRDYLAGVLVSESERRDPFEYLAALSTLQRNYSVVHRDRHAPSADLCDNTHCQRFSLEGADGAIYRAVDHGSKIELGSGSALPCYYSVNCGGETLTPLQVWKREERGYAPVVCSSCRGSRWYRWKRTIRSTPQVERVMRRAPAPPFVDDDFKITAGRAIGFNVVLSNTVDRISRQGGVYHVEGRGFGHRVGLCQDGARAMARNGRKAAGILRSYFPRTSIHSR